jgi:hypothetical protein
VLVREDYLLDRMVMYMLLGEGHTRRGVEAASAHAAPLADRARADAAVYAFPGATARLRLDGLDVDFNPQRLLQGSLEAYLDRLPAGSTAALAAPAIHAAAFAAVVPEALPHLRGPAEGLTLVPAGALPPGFDLRADRLDAASTFGGRDVARTSAGAVLGVWQADGELAGTFVLRAGDAFQVPFNPGPLSVRRLRGEMARVDVAAGECAQIAQVWNTGNAVVHVPAGATLTMTFDAEASLNTRVVDRSTDDLIAAVDADGARLELTAPEGTTVPVAALVALGAVPAEAVACLNPTGGAAMNETVRAQVMRQETRGLLRSAEAAEVLEMHRDEQAQLVGAGWSAVDVDAGGPFRWMTTAEARLLLPLATGGAERIELEIFATAGSEGALPGIAIQLNGMTLQSQQASEGWGRYIWPVPPGLAAAGTNRVVIRADPFRDGRTLAVSSVTVVYRTSASTSR